MKQIMIFTLVFLLLCTIGMAENQTARQLTAAAINTSQEEVSGLIEDGLPSTQVTDLLENAIEQFEAQDAIEAAGGKASYDEIYLSTGRISDLSKETYALSDELTALQRYLDAEAAETELAPAYKLYDEAVKEFNDERFEDAKELIDESYEKVSELQAASTKTKAILAASKENIEEFLKRTWKLILLEITVLLLLFLLFRKLVERLRLKAKIRRLEKERIILDNLIKQTQKAYFDEASISEGTYQIRIKKYGELIRDINRQIPMLKEEIALTKRST